MSVIHHLFDPVVGAVLLLLASLVAGHFHRTALARGLVIVTALFLTTFAALPLAPLLAKPLEDAYPRPSKPPAQVDGIVVLSGGLRVGVSWTRGVPSDNATALRMMAAADLARRYPKARLIFSGTTGGSAGAQGAEFQIAERMMQSLGVAPGRIVYERRSSDTWENLVFSRQIAHPKPGETWVLVTSATHMRRSMGVTRRIGWTMVPWPSDYDSAGDADAQPLGFASHNMEVLTTALHEWIGLLTYALEDKLA